MSEQRRGTFVFQALLLFLFAFWLFAFHTGDASLWDVDEPNNAQALKEMMLHHNLVVPTFSAALRPDKPILNYWLMWAGVRLLGMNSWGLRIGSVAMGALLVFYLALTLRRLYGDQTALLAGLLTATALHSQIIFRAAVPDPLLILFVAIALISYLRGYLYPEEERRGVLIACSAMGLATLAKGPIGFLLPGLIIVIFLLLRRDLPSLWRNGHLAWGIPLFLVITLPWYLAVGVETHWVWDWLFIDQQNVDRYAVAMQGHHGPVYYYLFTIALAYCRGRFFYHRPSPNSGGDGVPCCDKRPPMPLCWSGPLPGCLLQPWCHQTPQLCLGGLSRPLCSHRSAPLCSPQPDAAAQPPGRIPVTRSIISGGCGIAGAGSLAGTGANPAPG